MTLVLEDPGGETLDRFLPRLLETTRLLRLAVGVQLRSADYTGSVTSEWLKKTVGCSYPTVASSLRRVEASLYRHSDRRVELHHFPREEWWRLLAVGHEVRSTTRFVDRSGQPQIADVFLNRLKKLGRNDIAVGGVIGARHYQPSLDLVGTPRLDLSVHSRARNVDLSFVRELDPALKKSEGREEAARVVIHIVRRADPLFRTDR